MDIIEPMRNLSQQQKNEAEQLFSRALQCAQNNDFVGAGNYYRQSADMGHPGAQNNLGNLYENGRGVNKDPQEAVRLFTLSAKQGSVFGMRNLASCYKDGIGTDTDFDLAVDWLETAAEQKDNLACVMLAKAYDRWNHTDEGKKIFWHKKAAEYGNPDSMFALGEYYGKKGDNQDLSLASIYYDNAAKNGTPDMKLKVAKAFDMPSYGNETAINLEKAKYWYNELLTCENDSIKLDAAKGLDEMSDWDGTVKRPPLDINKAYMTYRMLAMKGNKSACSHAAYCSEVGKGTNPNIDIAIMFYEKAREFGKAAWCKKKKSGNLQDQVYEANVENVMPERILDPYSHGKEYYRGNVDLNVAEYNGLFYFIKRKYDVGTFLCSSDKEGDNIKIVSEVPDEYDYASIHINCTGIYLYYTQDSDRLFVLHLDHDGGKISECREEYEGGYEDGHSVSNVYFYGNDVFYTYKHNVEDEGSCVVKCMHIDAGTTDVLYERASSISELYATEGYLIFNARYSNEDCEQSRADGWMLLNILTNDIECISNPYCSPENVLDNPSYYDSESFEYNENYDFDRRIVSFDLSRKIFWIERSTLEGDDSAHLHQVKYWEPRSLWGNRDELVPGMPVWRITKNSIYSSREYFDGVIHYWDEGYYTFKSSNKYGQIFDWSEGNGGHGECDQYKIVGDYLFLNVAAYYEEQYPLTVGVSSPIRKSWFKNELSQSAIDDFRNQEKLFKLGESKEEIKTEDFEFNWNPESEPSFDLFEEEKSLEQEKLSDNIFDDSPFQSNIKLCDFRINAERFTGVRDTLISYRKSLDEKWDYNAFVGILLSVKGPKHGDIACFNLAIGQGDNFKSTETRLTHWGLLDVFEKYRGKKYNHEVTVCEVEDEIIQIAPELSEIRDFFDETVVKKMCDGSFDMSADNALTPIIQKDTNTGEASEQDLYVVKTIGYTDVKYNICTFGANFHIGFDQQVTIKINEKEYTAKSHNTVKGRINGTKKLYSENGIVLGDKLKATYISELKEIHLEKIN